MSDALNHRRRKKRDDEIPIGPADGFPARNGLRNDHFMRTTTGINKAEDARRKDAQIGFADTLRRIFLTALASYLQFRDWIR